MRRLDMWIVLAALLTVAVLVGCQSGTSGSGSTGSADPAEDNGNADDNANAQVENEDPGTADGLLTDEEAASVNENVVLVERLSGTFSTLAAADLPPLSGGPIRLLVAAPTCPSLSVGASQLGLDFGTNGCVSLLYPDITYSGGISADLNVEQGALVLTFEELGVSLEGQGSVTVTGTADGAINQDNGMILLGAAIDMVFLTDAGTLAVLGDLTFKANLNTGEMAIMTGELTTTDGAGQTNALVLSQVQFNPAEYGNLVPEAGTATLRLGTTGPGSVSIVITFTEGTPIDGSVLVSVNGSSPVSMLLEGLAGS